MDIKNILPIFVSTIYCQPVISCRLYPELSIIGREASSMRLFSAIVGNAIWNLIRDLKTFLVLVLNIYYQLLGVHAC